MDDMVVIFCIRLCIYIYIRRRHSVLMLLSLSSVTNLSLLFGFCAACMLSYYQEFIQRTGGLLIQSETHARKDLMGSASLDDVKSATFDHIIRWNFSNDDTDEMPAPKSTVHGEGT